MTTIAWPAHLIPQQASIGLQKAGLQFRGPFNGTFQAIDFLAERWVLSITMAPRKLANSGELDALIARLAGGVDRVTCWHFARPVPRGSMRGSPILSAGVTRGATSIAITTTAAATLKAGDMIGAGGQLFQVREDCTASGGGAITVPITNRVRASISINAAVTWDKPTATFAMPAMVGSVVFRPRLQESVAFDLEEVW